MTNQTRFVRPSDATTSKYTYNNNLKNQTNNVPVCRPLRFASLRNVTRARECTTAGFFIINPSLYNFDIFRRELAKAISFDSFGSNHILRLPHFNTDDANRFCNFNETI